MASLLYNMPHAQQREARLQEVPNPVGRHRTGRHHNGHNSTKTSRLKPWSNNQNPAIPIGVHHCSTCRIRSSPEPPARRIFPWNFRGPFFGTRFCSYCGTTNKNPLKNPLKSKNSAKCEKFVFHSPGTRRSRFGPGGAGDYLAGVSGSGPVSVPCQAHEDK